MKIAVIETGGKQYLVKEGQVIKIDKIRGKENDSEIEFSKVLLYADDQGVRIGRPFLSGVIVKGKVKERKKVKLLVWKYKAKTRYRKKKGHRREIWSVEITQIAKR